MTVSLNKYGNPMKNSTTQSENPFNVSLGSRYLYTRLRKIINVGYFNIWIVDIVSMKVNINGRKTLNSDTLNEDSTVKGFETTVWWDTHKGNAVS